MTAACRFYLRHPTPVRYESLHVNSPRGDGLMRTSHPPVPGDVLLLTTQHPERTGAYVVVARQWIRSSYGSVDWPYGQAEATSPPEAVIVIAEHPGVFADEAPLTGAERAQAGGGL